MAFKLLFLISVDSLMCYKCNSLYDADCVQVKETRFSYHYDYCNIQRENETVTEYKKPLCRKVRQKSEFLKIYAKIYSKFFQKFMEVFEKFL